MGKKIKVRKQKKPRSSLVVDMILTCKGGRHKDKRDKRNKREKEWHDELENDSLGTPTT